MEKIGTPGFQPEPEGDVEVVCEQGNGEKLTPLVSSKIMTMAPPVSKAMLGPHFAEGSKHVNLNRPQEITLKEGEPEVNQWVYWRLHFRRGLDIEVSVDLLYQIAGAIVKYDIAGGLRDHCAMPINDFFCCATQTMIFWQGCCLAL